MKCTGCNQNFIHKKGSIALIDKFIGDYIVNSTEYLECPHCRKKMYKKQTIKKIETQKLKIKDKLLRKLSINEYIGATSAANILGVSRQALHKHPKIRRGFIFRILLEKKFLYNRKSVELYKIKGDGRFSLINEIEKTPIIINEYAAWLIDSQGKTIDGNPNQNDKGNCNNLPKDLMTPPIREPESA